MAKIARVALDKATPAYDKLYDYQLPAGSLAQSGCRVLVPFGRGNKTRLAMIFEIFESDQVVTGLKTLSAVLDKHPILNEEGLFLAHYLHACNFSSRFDGVRCQLPPGAGIRVSIGLRVVQGTPYPPADALSAEATLLYQHLLTRKKLTDEVLCLGAIGLEAPHPAAEELVQQGLAVREQLVRKKILDKRAVMARLLSTEGDVDTLPLKQQRVYDLLQQIGSASVAEICYFCGVTKAVVEGLKKRALIELYEEITAPMPLNPAPIESKPILLSAQQQQAFEQILGTPDGTTLLRGVTGSGKTQVFLRLIEETLKQGRQALVLIPEISLTPQTVSRFSAQFGERVALLHSALSMTQRLETFHRIQAGEYPIVVGTRSAVFAPLQRIGLIVVDEEQENSYHSESAPRYHAIKIAQLRAKRHGARLLLCSATPSMESYFHTTTTQFKRAELSERYSKNPLPAVEIVDMSTALTAEDSAMFSQTLSEEIAYNLAHQEQTLLLLNRRGYSTMLKCSSCMAVLRCPHCSVVLTYHNANSRLVCHCCGSSIPEPKSCPNCKSAMLRYSGAGTQQAQEQLQRLFPTARLLRMDADSTMQRFSHQRGFEAFAAGEYDILLGTQMVAKGLDFPNVTLVGILSADHSLYTEDFRSYERTFSLITQAVGRSGRGEKPGRALIQTFSPEHSVIHLACAQDYEAFYQEELTFRKAALYPPFCNLVSIVFSCAVEQHLEQETQRFFQQFSLVAGENYSSLPIRVLGPAPDYPYKAAGKYRLRLLLKCRESKGLYQLLRTLWDWHYGQRPKAQLTIDLYY